MSRKGDLIQVDQGPVGPAGPVGAINLLSIEGSIAFTTTAPFWAVTYDYTTVKGAVWEATGVFNYANNASFISVILTNFLIDTTKKYNVWIETTDQQHNGTTALPVNFPKILEMQIVEKANDKLRFRVVHKPSGNPEPNGPRIATVGQGYNIESIKFSLYIVAED